MTVRAKIYLTTQPLMYDFSDIDISQTRLVEIQDFDANWNIVRNEFFDEDGTLETTDVNTYREDNKPASFEVFVGPERKLFRRTVFDYTENGELKSEIIYVDGKSVSEKINRFDSENLLLKTVLRQEEKPETVTNFQWHRLFPSSCIRKEIVVDGKITEIVQMEWDVVNNEAVLTKEHLEKLDLPMDSRTFFYFDGREMENGVTMEIFNDLGNYMEEERDQYDSKGRIVRRSNHTDASSGNVPYREELYEYDEKDRVILNQLIQEGRIIYTAKTEFNSDDRFVKKLLKTNNETQIYFYWYETVPG